MWLHCGRKATNSAGTSRPAEKENGLKPLQAILWIVLAKALLGGNQAARTIEEVTLDASAPLDAE
jgi:hypothetical protein